MVGNPAISMTSSAPPERVICVTAPGAGTAAPSRIRPPGQMFRQQPVRCAGSQPGWQVPALCTGRPHRVGPATAV